MQSEAIPRQYFWISYGRQWRRWGYVAYVAVMTIFCEEHKLCGSSSFNCFYRPVTTSSPQMLTSLHLKPCPSLGVGNEGSSQSKTARKISFLYDKRAKLMYVIKNVNLAHINYFTGLCASLALRSAYCYGLYLCQDRTNTAQAYQTVSKTKNSGVPTRVPYIELWLLSLSLSLLRTRQAANCTSN